MKRVLELTAFLSITASSISCAAAAGDTFDGCTLPQFRDDYIGFVVGKPAGWSIHYENGVIALREDSRGITTALAYPVLLKANQSAEQALADFFSLLRKVSSESGERLEGTPGRSSAESATLSVSGEINGRPVAGELEATLQGRDLLIKGGWSEEGRWSDLRSTILAVGSCYRKSQGTALTRQRQTGGGDYYGGATTTYEFSLPEGWQVSGITFRGIDLNYDDVTGVSFAYLTGAAGQMTPDGWMNQMAQLAGFSNLSVLGERVLDTVTDPFGLRWQMKVKEYEANFKGSRVHGVMTAALTNIGSVFGYGSYSAMMAIRQSRADQWDRFSAISAVLQESIRIVDAKAGQNIILPKNNPADSDSIMSSWEYRNRVGDRLSAKWEESIMGYDNLRSPSTGQTYQLPLNSWDPTGPEGPGYYRGLPGGFREKLVRVNP